MKQAAILFILLNSPFQMWSQWASEIYVANNFVYANSANGSIFFSLNSAQLGLKVPVNESIYALIWHGLAVGGLDNEGNIHTAVRTLRCMEPFQNQICSFVPGPIKLDGTAPFDGPEMDYFNRIWYVNSEMVLNHQLFFDCLENPGCDEAALFPGGYIIPDAFLTWPAHSYEFEGYDYIIASFFDRNANGVYEPLLGDHPLFCGDECTYFVMNDVASDIPSSLSTGMGLEVHTMVYSFNSEQDALFNSLFVHQKVINKSNTTYYNTYFGYYTDFDLGNYLDDYVGTDVSRSMVYAYNGDDFDESSSSGPGYGYDLPALGMRYLAGPYKDANGMDDLPYLNTSGHYANQTSGWGDGIPDNERLGLSTSIDFAQVPFVPKSTPMNPNHVYENMNGSWNDGSHLTVGGDGYNALPETISSKYCYFGNSDSLFIGTSGIDPNLSHSDGWTEGTAYNPPGDRIMLSASGPFTFTPGSTQYLDYAIIFARDSHQPGVDVLETLRSYADEIVGMECAQLPQIVTGTRNTHLAKAEVRLYPNPALEILTVQAPPGSTRFAIHDLSGRLVKGGMVNATQQQVNIQDLTTGMYVLVLYEADGRVAGRARFVKAM